MRLRTPAFALAALLLGVPPGLFPAQADVTWRIDTFAGSDLVGDGGPATAAQLADARGGALDRQGNLYISDTDNHRVRKVTPAGIISTVAGTCHAGFSGDGGPAASAQLSSPYGLAVDAAGNLYIADYGNQRVRRVAPDGSISTVAGTGQKGSGGDGGPGVAAQLMSPRNLAIDSVGNLYVSEFEGHRVRKIARDGTMYTVAGTGVAGLNLDPNAASMPAVAAQLAYPAGLAMDAYDALYIADSGNNLVRRLWGGNITTALDGRTNPAFLLYSPTGVAIDGSGFLYVTDSTAYVRKLYAGQLMSVAGSGDVGYAADGGLAVNARLTGPHDIAFDAKGSLYIADGQYVRKVAGGVISTVAGNGYASGIGDGLPATLAQMVQPAGIALDAAGNLFVADTGTERVRKVDSKGIIETVAGNGQAGYAGDGGPAMAAELSSPAAAAADAAGNVYIADTKNDRVRRLLASGFLITAAGIGVGGMGPDNQFAPTAPLNQPRGVAVDAAGSLYIADTGNHRVVRITAAGTLVAVAGAGSPGWSGDNGRAVLAQLNSPAAIAFDRAGNLYIADTFNHVIRKVTPAGTITTVAGSGAAGFAGDGAAATSGRLNFPAGVAADAAGNLYIADTWNHRIRMVDGSGILHTIAGSGTQGYAGDGSLAPAAQLNFPAGIAVDAHGVIYFSDTFNNRVRKLTAQAATEVAPQPVIDAALVNAASLQPGPVAPGEIVTLFAAGVGPATGVTGQADAQGAMPTTLGGLQVLFDGTPAPLFYAQSGQINLQVPYGVSGSTQVEVIEKGVSMLRQVVPVATSAPGIFAGAILNEDGTVNGPANPAPKNSIVTLFATGEGAVSPAGATGKAMQAPFPEPLLPVALSIGANPCELLYAGSAPGFVGLMQINARVPGGFVPTGTLPVVLTIGAAASQPGVTIVVK
jgi:uncharacterized protein (TIGR03437 family)